MCCIRFIVYTACAKNAADMPNEKMRIPFWSNTAETGICLAFATAVNAAMLVLSAAHFYPERVVSLAQASAQAAGSSGSGIVAAAQKFMCSFLGSGAGQFL